MSGLTREERLLQGESLTPVTRREKFLAKAGGADIETPTPVTREEMFLSAITGGGGGSSGGGGGGVVSADKKDVNFYDYDGTILHSYTLNEAQALSELPELPTRDGLVCQGWNWTLEDIKAMGRAVDVGATYITDDGATRIYIRLSEERTSPMLGVCPRGTVTVDWGDGTAPDTLTGTSLTTPKWTPTHNYAKPGEYVIRLFVDGSVGLTGSNTANKRANLLRCSDAADGRNPIYQSFVQRVELGDGVTSLGNSAFDHCYSLSSITIPNGVTSIGNYVFDACFSLSSITIPKGLTSIGSTAFRYCANLSSVVIPKGVTNLCTFYECYSLSSITIPDGVNYIGFRGCHSLSSITIPKGLTSIASDAFYECFSLSNVVITEGVTSIGNSAFYECNSLSSVVIPEGVTSIGDSAFYNCNMLSSVVIPNSVTSIGSSAFYSCFCLSSVTIPSNVMSISKYAFSYCSGVKYYDFTNHTDVPTLGGAYGFGTVASDCEIRVPAALVDEWKAATNWSTYADYIVGV